MSIRKNEYVNRVLRMGMCLREFGVRDGIRFIRDLQDFRRYRKGNIKEVESKLLQLRYHDTVLTYRTYTSDVMIILSILIGYKNTWPLTGEYNLPGMASPDWIFDLGANIGIASIYYRKKYPKAEIVAVECETSNFQMLNKNVRHLRVKTIQAGVWHHQCELKIETATEEKDAFQCVETDEKGQGTFQGVDIDTLINRYHMQGYIMIKMDIEGAEKNIFEHFQDAKWPDLIQSMIIEIHECMYEGLTKDIVSKMKARGFKGRRERDVVIFDRIVDKAVNGNG